MKRISLIVLILVLQACSSNTPKPHANELLQVDIEANADSNRNIATAMDLVFVKDPEVAKLLNQLTGPQWFERKAELMLRYANSISVAAFEVVPLTLEYQVPLPKHYDDAPNILLFANYLASEGQYVSELTPFKHLKIRLLRDQYQLIEVNTAITKED